MFIFTKRRQRVTRPENKIKPESQPSQAGIIVMMMGSDLGIKSFPVKSQR